MARERADSQRVRWHPVTDRAALHDAAYRWVLAAATASIAARGRFLIVLSGGTTPRPLYERLRYGNADWARWHIWFADERCVPLNDQARTSTAVSDTWLSHVPIPSSQVQTIPTELGAGAAAQRYAEALQRVPQGVSPWRSGMFDVVLLGLGADGHTASLFPGSNLGESRHSPDTLAVFDAPTPPPHRVSLSANRLSRARHVLFLVEGEAKRGAVARWRARELIPARTICPRDGVDVLVEASLLKQSVTPER